MKNSKFLLAALVAAVSMFILGWIIYGMFLMDFMYHHSGVSKDILKHINRPMDQMNMLLMIVANLAGGLLIASIANWAKAGTFMAGAKTGFIVGVLIAINKDCMIYATSHMLSKTSLCADMAGLTVLMAFTMAITAMVLGKGQTTKS